MAWETVNGTRYFYEITRTNGVRRRRYLGNGEPLRARGYLLVALKTRSVQTDIPKVRRNALVRRSAPVRRSVRAHVTNS